MTISLMEVCGIPLIYTAMIITNVQTPLSCIVSQLLVLWCTWEVQKLHE